MAKNKLENTTESVFDKMAEAYRDCEQQKKKLLQAIDKRNNKWTAEDIEEEVNLSKADSDNLKLLDNLIDKKVKLIQMHIKLVNKTLDDSDDGDDNKVADQPLSQSDLESLRKIALEELSVKKDLKYNLEDGL